ncbi:hypothetical protein niasHT_032594 [Heterodera trifolii]|uniref:Uncharacterized protein n=1 Tax=Heterodera trifolii TaxID=157864 RepID=A0ABD2J3W8_9BILA
MDRREYRRKRYWNGIFGGLEDELEGGRDRGDDGWAAGEAERVFPAPSDDLCDPSSQAGGDDPSSAHKYTHTTNHYPWGGDGRRTKGRERCRVAPAGGWHHRQNSERTDGQPGDRPDPSFFGGEWGAGGMKWIWGGGEEGGKGRMMMRRAAEDGGGRGGAIGRTENEGAFTGGRAGEGRRPLTADGVSGCQQYTDEPPGAGRAAEASRDPRGTE